MRVDVLTAERPVWRGLMHFWTFLLAIPAGVLLIVFADRPAARTAAAIYAATLLLVFGTSAAYHRLAQSYRARLIMQRIDHSMIYLLIAGTYVPICLIALPRAWGISLLAVVGSMGVTGIVLKLVAFQRFQWISYALYPLMGWAAVAAAPALADEPHADAARVDHRRRCRVHDRLPGAGAAPSRSVAHGVRLSRDLARLHRRRRDAALRRGRTARRLTVPLFDSYVAIDWSAKAAPASGTDSIWIAVLDHDGEVALANPPTRQAAARLLRGLIAARGDRRTLVGIDVGLGYPAGTADLLGVATPGVPAWRAMWAAIASAARRRRAEPEQPVRGGGGAQPRGG